ncbi:tumor protein D52 isoform X2 [Paramormyrops kingsleyae]|uniref:Tumor protein D52 n=1 Tax=Paramormyrops kingsleyae TaxID=1676925 RepID=A0A3B3RYX3_9TELE|nr:tumor protein D52-like isoform X2 [Paramormyrops kingsleyae]
MDLADDYMSPFNFEQGVNTSYLYLSPTVSLTQAESPGSPLREAPRPPELGEDAISAVDTCDSTVALEDQEELHSQLAKVEDEIQALCQVLASKEKRVAEIKRKLGITPLNELKQTITRNWQEVTTSTAYKKTSESLSHAGERATAAYSSVGLAVSRTLEDVRNTAAFKSFEEKVEYLKTKMSLMTSTGPDLQDQDATRGPPSGEQPE